MPTKDQIHDLAVAYAQTKLTELQNSSDYSDSGSEEEVHRFMKYYYFALYAIENDEQDEYF